MDLLVKNPPVPRVGFPDDTIMAKFRAVVGVKNADLLPQQEEAFRHVLEGKAVRLVAGTASGKTLAVALPLFEKLERGEIQKVIFLYPTLALMEDQRRVMDLLAGVYGFEGATGTIRGGMPRSRLVDALGKKVIVATPDAIYWFLRKNVKYSHLLIYGLLLADEIVVDEAHLFAGLSAQNLTAFLERLKMLRNRYLGTSLKVHLLTATWPEDGTLNGLSPNAEYIDGRSLVGDVRFWLRREDGLRERSEALVGTALEFLNTGSRNVLLVLNSARKAHIAFNQITGASARARRLDEVPDDFKLGFGVVEVQEALKVAERFGLLEIAERRVREEVPLRLSRIKKAVAVELRGEALARSYGDYLERTARDLKSKVWRAARGKQSLSAAEVEISLGAESSNLLKEMGVEDFADYMSFKEQLDAQTSSAQQEVERALEAAETEKGVRLTLPEMPELKGMLGAAPLFKEFGRGFRRGLILDKDSVSTAVKIPVEAFRGVRVSVAQFMAWFDKEEREELGPEILRKTEHRAVRRIRDREDGAVAILYSGSMPRYAREGLIELFSNLRVPVVLVSTSAVEVGVDFDADAMVTEECSGSSFLQRFGRVGRRSGTQAAVALFVGAEKNAALVDKLGGRGAIGRTDFSRTIMEALPARVSLRESRYVEASQRDVTYQIGEVGREVGGHDSRVDDLLNELRGAGVEFSYGLRGTMPSVQLREGVGKSPFYALRFADSEHVFPPDSPFELAQLDRAFDEIIYASWEEQRDVFVDLERTWPSVRSMAYLDGSGDLRMAIIPSSWRNLKGVRDTLVRVPQARTLGAKMGASSSMVLDILGQRVGLPAGALTHPEALLFYGDLVLGWRVPDPEVPDKIEPIPFHVRDQWMLLLPAWEDTDVETLLAKHGLVNLEELFYDYDGLKHENGTDSKALGLVILEEQAGACLAAWEKIVGG